MGVGVAGESSGDGPSVVRLGGCGKWTDKAGIPRLLPRALGAADVALALPFTLLVLDFRGDTRGEDGMGLLLTATEVLILRLPALHTRESTGDALPAVMMIRLCSESGSKGSPISFAAASAPSSCCIWCQSGEPFFTKRPL